MVDLSVLIVGLGILMGLLKYKNYAYLKMSDTPLRLFQKAGLIRFIILRNDHVV
jgi:hypothetical protein